MAALYGAADLCARNIPELYQLCDHADAARNDCGYLSRGKVSTDHPEGNRVRPGAWRGGAYLYEAVACDLSRSGSGDIWRCGKYGADSPERDADLDRKVL